MEGMPPLARRGADARGGELLSDDTAEQAGKSLDATFGLSYNVPLTSSTTELQGP